MSIKPQYFTEWLEYVEPEQIIKTEKIVAKFQNNLDNKSALNELIKSVKALNKLDEKEGFIMTTEAENLVDKLTEIALSKGLNNEEIEKQIENRTW